MKSRTSLKEALQAMAKESEGRPSPTIDQLIAYHQGRLSEPEREQVQDYLCYSPEAIQFLLHLGHSRDMEELTDEMVAADKEAFFQRLEQQDQEERVAEEGALGDSSPATRHPTADSRHDSQPEALLDPHHDSWPSRLQTAYAMAAAFFFLSLALFLWPALSPPPNGVDGDGLNLARRTLDATSSRRGSDPRDELITLFSDELLWLEVGLQDVNEDQGAHLVIASLETAATQDLIKLPEADSSRVKLQEDGQAVARFALEEALQPGRYSAAIFLLEGVANPPATAQDEAGGASRSPAVKFFTLRVDERAIG